MNERELMDIIRYLPPGHSAKLKIYNIGYDKFGWYKKDNKIFIKTGEHVGNL